LVDPEERHDGFTWARKKGKHFRRRVLKAALSVHNPSTASCKGKLPIPLEEKAFRSSRTKKATVSRHPQSVRREQASALKSYCSQMPKGIGIPDEMPFFKRVWHAFVALGGKDPNGNTVSYNSKRKNFTASPIEKSGTGSKWHHRRCLRNTVIKLGGKKGEFCRALKKVLTGR